MAVSTEAGQADAVAHRHHVSSQHKGWLSDVVDKEAGLRGHQEYFGLPLGAHHSQMSVSTGVLRGWWRKVNQLALPRPVRVLGSVGVPPNLIGALNERSHTVQETKTQDWAFQHQDCSWHVDREEGRQKARSLELWISKDDMSHWCVHRFRRWKKKTSKHLYPYVCCRHGFSYPNGWKVYKRINKE